MSQIDQRGDAQRLSELVSSLTFIVGWPVLYISGWFATLPWWERLSVTILVASAVSALVFFGLSTTTALRANGHANDVSLEIVFWLGLLFGGSVVGFIAFILFDIPRASQLHVLLAFVLGTVLLAGDLVVYWETRHSPRWNTVVHVDLPFLCGFAGTLAFWALAPILTRRYGVSSRDVEVLTSGSVFFQVLASNFGPIAVEMLGRTRLKMRPSWLARAHGTSTNHSDVSS